MKRRPAAAPDVPAPSPAILRLRELAAQAAGTGTLAEAPAHPDAKLLELCGEALHSLEERQRLWRLATAESDATKTPIPHAELRALSDYDSLHTERARLLMRQAGKLRARTGAGVYAKAVLCRHSRTGAPMLAKSLADDLINSPALRATLWAPPAGGDA